MDELQIQCRGRPTGAQVKGLRKSSNDNAGQVGFGSRSVYEVIVDGAIIRVMGAVVAYDYFRITEQDGALTVELEVNDPAEEDDFQRRNITGLVITPEGEFFVYNVKFSEQLVRP